MDSHVNRRSFLAAAAALTVLPEQARAAMTIDAASREAVGSAATAAAKVRAVIDWTHRRLDWTATDYQRRTPQEILDRGGGNCYEQASVVRALLAPAGVPTRLTREINIQPANPERERDAEALIAREGLRASVFGERHNDHVWTEYEDHELGEWVPADPTLNVIGVGPWVLARLGFGARPVHEVIPYADMLFPIAVVVPSGPGQFVKRTRRLLVEGFAHYVPGLARCVEWPEWTRRVSTAEEHLILTLQGRYNFHDDRPNLDALIAIYAALKARMS